MTTLKIMTVLGTRPEIIRLSCILPKLKQVANHLLVHTGQNFESSLSSRFFEELELKAPDYNLDIHATNAASQIGEIIARCDELFERESPDRVFLLGDTNSSLCAIMAKRRGIPVLHLEAGNRCYDDRVPEEVNRRIIDHSSDILMPYTEQSRRNLLGEGIEGQRIYVTGNPIHEVLDRFKPKIDASTVVSDMGLEEGRFFLVTLHRSENVDVAERLRTFVAAFCRLAETTGMPVVVSTHPRTRHKIQEFGVSGTEQVVFAEPFGFCDFVKLEKSARVVLTDSGTIQEECCILGVAAVTLRDTTERPETIECGSNVLTGCDEVRILAAVERCANSDIKWTPPPEYTRANVSKTVVNVVLNYYSD